MSERAEPKGGLLTDREKALRDWLREQPGGAEKWLIIKAGFKRSYNIGLADAEARAEAAVIERLLSDELVEHIANWVPLGFTERDPYANTVEASRAILAAATEALRGDQ